MTIPNTTIEIQELSEVYCNECTYCKEQLTFAKKHNLRVIYDNASKCVVGVEYDPNRWK
jgi:hypothetical protein